MEQKIRVAVLMGGQSAERTVSLATGRQVLNALDRDRYEVYAIDTASGQRFLPDAGAASSKLLPAEVSGPVLALTELPQIAAAERPDVVFIALHGPGGEDGTVQGFLEVLGIPYTGSGVLASALAMDKVRCKAMLATANIPTPAGLWFSRKDRVRWRRGAAEVTRQLGFPVVVKPNQQGSSYGARIVTRAEDLLAAFEDAFRYDDTVLVEERLEGVEITVAVLGTDDAAQALPPVEIIARDGFFDYEAKYSTGESGAIEICPARIEEEETREALALALECHRVLGCRGMSRTDMFVTEHGCIVLEINTIPGMTPTSLLPKAAQAAGISFSALLDRLIADARDRS